VLGSAQTDGVDEQMVGILSTIFGIETMKTDIQLQNDVIAELKWEPSVHAEKIGVEVSAGVVTLAGHVGSYAEKDSAQRAAQRVVGVKALAMEMDVKLSGLGLRNDTDIAQAAQNLLEWNSGLPVDSVKCLVDNGWITLSGSVPWQYQRVAADRAVRHLHGVVGLTNGITVKPSVSVSAVKTDIESALKRRAASDAQKVMVQVNGAEVTLSGTVPSWSERDLARDAAWGAPGVCKVVDNIAVGY
jgi:osmotically-inducible protein OsmY